MNIAHPAVDLRGMHSDMLPAMMELDQLWREEVGYELIITAGRNGNHAAASRHWIGCAFDMRTWTTADSGVQLPKKRRNEMLVLVRAILDKQPIQRFLVLDKKYKVVDSNGNTLKRKTHFHIQLQEAIL